MQKIKVLLNLTCCCWLNQIFLFLKIDHQLLNISLMLKVFLRIMNLIPNQLLCRQFPSWSFVQTMNLLNFQYGFQGSRDYVFKINYLTNILLFFSLSCIYLWEMGFDKLPFFCSSNCCENFTFIIKCYSYSSLTDSTSSSVDKYRITTFHSTTDNQSVYYLKKIKMLICISLKHKLKSRTVP